MVISTETRCLIVLPLPFVDVPIHVNELALSVCLVVCPLSFISGTIWPYLNALAFSNLSSPGAFVDDSLVEANRCSLFKGGRLGGVGFFVIGLLEIGFVVFGDTRATG